MTLPDPPTNVTIPDLAGVDAQHDQPAKPRSQPAKPRSLPPTRRPVYASPMRNRTIRMTDEQWEVFMARGGADKLREFLESELVEDDS